MKFHILGPDGGVNLIAVVVQELSAGLEWGQQIDGLLACTEFVFFANLGEPMVFLPSVALCVVEKLPFSPTIGIVTVLGKFLWALGREDREILVWRCRNSSVVVCQLVDQSGSIPHAPSRRPRPSC